MIIPFERMPVATIHGSAQSGKPILEPPLVNHSEDAKIILAAGK
jgi:hypothetical protein